MLLNCPLDCFESPLDCKEIKPVNPKGNQSLLFIGDTDAGKDWRHEEKGMTEDEMVGWHHQLNGHDFEQASGLGDGQGGLVCCSPWGHKESDTTEKLNWTISFGGFPCGSVVKNPPAMEEMQVRSLSRKNPLEEEMAILSSSLAWRIPWREEPGRLQSIGSQRVRHDWATEQHTHNRFFYTVKLGNEEPKFLWDISIR